MGGVEVHGGNPVMKQQRSGPRHRHCPHILPDVAQRILAGARILTTPLGCWTGRDGYTTHRWPVDGERHGTTQQGYEVTLGMMHDGSVSFAILLLVTTERKRGWEQTKDAVQRPLSKV